MIDDLGWLDNAVARAVAEASQNGMELEWRPARECASAADILASENAIETHISKSHREFLERWNGASLYVEGTGTIWILSVHEIVEKTLEARKYWKDREGFDTWERMLVFADYEDGNLCNTDARSTNDLDARVIDAYGELNPSFWRRDGIIAASFKDWFEKVFAAIGGGKHATYWIPTP